MLEMWEVGDLPPDFAQFAPLYLSTTWTSTPSSACARARQPADIKRAYGGWRDAIIRGSTRVIAPRSRCIGRISEAYETLVDPDRRRAYDSAGERGARRGGRDVRVHGVRFLVGGARAAGGDVHRALRRGAASGDAGRLRASGAGGRHPRRGHGLVRGVDARRGAAGRRDAAGHLRGVPRRSGRCARRKGDAVRATAPARCGGRAATWCSRRAAPRATAAAGSDRSGAPRAPATAVTCGPRRCRWCSRRA